MAYEPYVTPEYYQTEYEGSAVPTDELKKALRQASRHIDSLTGSEFDGPDTIPAGPDPGSGLPAG